MPDDTSSPASAEASGDLVAAVHELLRYADEHRYSRGSCPECGDGRCYDEWALLRDEIRSLLRPSGEH